MTIVALFWRNAPTKNVKYLNFGDFLQFESCRGEARESYHCKFDILCPYIHIYEQDFKSVAK